MLRPLLKRAVRATVGDTGLKVLGRQPAHLDAFWQQRELLSEVPLPMILDVGAYQGGISRTYAGLFPTATIHALEPFRDSFELLRSNVGHLGQVKAHHLGLADVAGEMTLNVNAFDATNSLLETDDRARQAWGDGLLETRSRVACRFSTLDAFLEEQKIDRVDLLKLDVQGAEGKVLQGGIHAFEAARVGVIYMEIITMPTYRGQWGLVEHLKFLGDHGFHLHGLYNQLHVGGRLRQMDAIFVHDDRA